MNALLRNNNFDRDELLRRIYEIDDLSELSAYLKECPDREWLSRILFDEFIRHSSYRNAVEWNRAVRICECLAIAGWGDHEPLEAIRGVYPNGNPNTYFINRDSIPRFLDAVWSGRKDGVAIDYSRSVAHDSSGGSRALSEGFGEVQEISLKSQRNWIPKNPILITRGLANCYENTRPVIDSIECELKPELSRSMRPELYGNAIDRIVINCSFSFYDDHHCKTNYIIADESLKLKQKDFYPTLLTMFSEQEIEENGYYLRNRYSYGPFRADTGVANIYIVFEREFSELPQEKQKELMCEYFLHALRTVAKRLAKKIDYDFDLMISDFSAIIDRWIKS